MSLLELSGPLQALLVEHGFEVRSTDAGSGSGGPFETTVWARGDRRLRLFLRHGRLAVRYEVGELGMAHDEYMRELLGLGGSNRFPTYANDPVASVAALVDDLRSYGDDFLEGDGSAFRRMALAVRSQGAMTGLQRIRAIEDRLRER